MKCTSWAIDTPSGTVPALQEQGPQFDSQDKK